MEMFYVRVPREREAEAEHVSLAGTGVVLDHRPDGVYLGAPLDKNRALSREARMVLTEFDERIKRPRPRDARGKIIKSRRGKKKAKKAKKAKVKAKAAPKSVPVTVPKKKK